MRKVAVNPSWRQFTLYCRLLLLKAPRCCRGLAARGGRDTLLGVLLFMVAENRASDGHHKEEVDKSGGCLFPLLVSFLFDFFTEGVFGVFCAASDSF